MAEQAMDVPEDLREALALAIDLERKGRQYYLSAARRTSDPVIAAVFEALASDEEHHERSIRAYYQALQKTEGWPEPEANMAPPPPARQRVQEIMQRVGQQLQGDSGLQDVYEAARQMEQRSRDMYRELASRAEDSKVQKFFRFLAGFEQAHLEVLRLLIEASS